MAEKLLYRLIAQETLHKLERYCLLIGLFLFLLQMACLAKCISLMTLFIFSYILVFI